MMAPTFITLVGLLAVAKYSQGKNIQDHIYNGYTASKGQIPYQTLQIQQNRDSTYTLCGGALISNNIVLTAAHCVINVYQKTVYLGMTDTKDGSGVIYYVVPASSTWYHAYFSTSTLQNDIAFFRLPGTVSFTSQIQPISLPRKGWAAPSSFDNYYVTASGWGRTYDQEGAPHQFLQYRTIGKMPQRDCVNYYRNSLQVTDGMICTQKYTVYAGPCQGDSGGPLTVQTTIGLFLIGLVSWGGVGCSSDHPNVYTNVAYYLDWISYNTGIPVS